MAHNKTKATIGRLVAAGILFWSLGAQAQNIVYQVDRTFGVETNILRGITKGTIIGTIETDGQLGALGTENIVSWSFEAFDGKDIVSISSAGVGGLQGHAWGFLSATATELTFDFDGARNSGLQHRYITFNGGGTNEEGMPFSFDYSLLANYVGEIEQLVHQFGAIGEHRVDSPPRSGQVVIARVDDPVAADCGAPAVGLGEVLAGFQAGFTGGTHTEFGPANDFFVAFGGEDRRGFVIPESIDRSDQCENDYILVSGFVGALISRANGTVVRSTEEARNLALNGFDGFFAGQRFEVDGVLIDQMNTTAKLWKAPNGARFAVVSSGIILEPYSLSPGLHAARIIYEISLNGDGNVDDEPELSAAFRINAASEE